MLWSKKPPALDISAPSAPSALVHMFHHNPSVYLTQWFHTSVYDERTPAQSAQLVSDLFLDILHTKHLSLSVSESQFRRLVCEATCSLRRFSELSNPRRKFPRPLGWNEEIESYWNECLHVHIVSDAFWDSFWVRIPRSAWEDSLPTWRATLQSILPMYIRRDIDVLVFYEYIVENDEGEFISNEDYDAEAAPENDSYYY